MLWCQTRPTAEGRAFHALRIAVISVLPIDGDDRVALQSDPVPIISVVLWSLAGCVCSAHPGAGDKTSGIGQRRRLSGVRCPAHTHNNAMATESGQEGTNVLLGGQPEITHQ